LAHLLFRHQRDLPALRHRLNITIILKVNQRCDGAAKLLIHHLQARHIAQAIHQKQHHPHIGGQGWVGALNFIKAFGSFHQYGSVNHIYSPRFVRPFMKGDCNLAVSKSKTTVLSAVNFFGSNLL
jgi:hypothetical protein